MSPENSGQQNVQPNHHQAQKLIQLLRQQIEALQEQIDQKQLNYDQKFARFRNMTRVNKRLWGSMGVNFKEMRAEIETLKRHIQTLETELKALGGGRQAHHMLPLQKILADIRAECTSAVG